MDLNTAPMQDVTRLGVDTVPTINALEVAYLRTEVALDAVPLIDDVCEERRARGLVVGDIAECWLRMGPAARAAYGSKTYSGLTAFIGDYVEGVDRSWLPDGTEPFDVDEVVADQLSREGWTRHIARLHRRAATGASTDPWWLNRFPTLDVRE